MVFALGQICMKQVLSIFLRIDRALNNVDWQLQFDGIMVECICGSLSDHAHLLLKFHNLHHHITWQFKYYEMWMQDVTFNRILTDAIQV